MKKHINFLKGKKVLSLLLALIMVLSVASPALSPIMGIVAKAADADLVELAFDNLFIFEQWANSAMSGKIPDGYTDKGTLTKSIENGTLTIANTTGATDFYTGFDFDKCGNYYTIPVEGDTAYNFSFGVSGNLEQYESYVFYYDSNFKPIKDAKGENVLNAERNKNNWSFTTPVNAAYIQVRFDNDKQGSVTFSNIRICKADTYITSSSPVRQAYEKNSGTYGELPTPPSRTNYIFGGWFTADGVQITDKTKIGASSRSVFARWNKEAKSISVKEMPSKTVYTVGEHINTTGLVLSGVAFDDSAIEITSGFTCTPEVFDTVGTQQTVTVKYGGASTTFKVDVVASVNKNITVDGTSVSTEVTNGKYTFNCDTKDFDYYSITYKTSSYMKGLITFDDNTSEEFFLEPSDNGSFGSYIDNFFDSNKTVSHSGIKTIEFTYLDKNFGDFELLSVKTVDKNHPSTGNTDNAAIFQNDEFKVGINFEWGGTLAYLEDLKNKPKATANNSGTDITLGSGSGLNLINTYDKGRYVQTAYYGTDGENDGYVQGYYGTDEKGDPQAWPYNPVQGGNQKKMKNENEVEPGFNEASKVVDYEIIYEDPNATNKKVSEIYVKTQALDWAKEETKTPSYMETRYVFESGMIKVYCRFVDFSGYNHNGPRRQEIPAMYPIEPFNEFVYYTGGDAWSSSNTQVRKQKSALTFNNVDAGSTPKEFNDVNENWAAFVNEKDYGIGIYSSRADGFSAGVFTPKNGEQMSTGTAPTNDDPSSYLTPFATYTMQSYKVEETAYYITTGSVAEIRSDFEKVANPNYGENFGKGRIAVPETVYMKPSTGASTTGQYYVNNTLASDGYSITTDAVNNATSGKVQYNIPGATNVKISATNVTSGGTVNLGNIATTSNSATYNETDLALSVSNGVNVSGTALIEWKFEATVGGSTRTYYAYTTLYAPWYLPVGAATRAKTNSQAFAQSITWISGVHGYTANPSGQYYIGVTGETYNDEGQYTDKGTYYAKTSNHAMVPLIYGVGTAPDVGTGVSDWLSTTSPGGGVTDPTIRYFSLNNSGSNGGVMVVDMSPIANITVDTSRYTNFNQIPNLTVGHNVTDTDGAGSVYWYTSDYTDVAHQYTKANNGTTSGKPCFFNWTKSTGKNDIDDYEDEWFNGASTGSIYSGSATSATSNYSTGVEYNSTYNRSIVTGSAYYDYMFKGAQQTYNGNRAYSINYVQLRATNVNKADLRKLVLQASAIDESMGYTTTSWSTFKSALQAAAQVLGDPDVTAAEVTNATTSLKNAINGLQTVVRVYENKGTDDIKYTDEYVNVASVDSKNNVTLASAATFTPTVPTRNGYELVSWSNSRALGTGTDYGKGTITVPFNATIYAQWKPLQYKVTYKPGDGATMVTTSTTYTIEDSFALETASRTGYTFNGWLVTTADGSWGSGETYGGGAAISGKYGNVTLTAQWIPNEYTVIFDNLFDFSKFGIRGGVKLENRTDTGFTVTSTAEDGNTGFSDVIPVEPGKTYIFSADFSIERVEGDTKGYDMYIHTLDSSYAGEKTATVDTSNGARREGDVYMTLSGQTENGNKYIKFTAGSNTAYIRIRFDANTPNNVLTVNNIRVYEEGTVANGVSYVNSKTVVYDSAFGTLPTPTRTGYTFNTWKDGDTPVNASSIVNSASTVYLKSDWSANKYTIVFNGNGATSGSMANMSMTYDASANLTANKFSKTGYTFDGWKDGSGNPYTDGQSVKNLTTTNKGTVTLTAQWKANSYTVKFDANGGSGSMSDQTMTYGTAKSLTENTFTKKGYTFAGWNTAANGSGTGYTDKQSVSTLAPSGTVTLYAQWTANSYKVAFDGNGATSGSMSEQSITYDKATALATNGFSKTGYTFKGWSETKGGTVKYNNGASVTNLAESGSVTLYAVWEANSYTIRFNSNGGTGTMNDLAMTYDAGKALTANKFTRTGYTFAGWSTTEGGAVVHTDGKTVKNLATSGVVTLYAVWNEHTYNVGYDANGPVVDIDTTKNVNYTSNVTLPAADALEWTDGTFRGWSLTQFATTAEFAPGATVPVATLIEKANIANGGSWTLYAVWEITGNCFKADKDYVDFGLPVTFNTAENDSEILGYHISTTGFKTSFEYGFDSTNYAKTLTVEGKGIFRVETDAQNSSEYYITFTPTGIINEAIEVTYYGKLTYSDGTVKEFDNTVTVIPASNMLYEEKLITLVSGDSVAWSQMGTSSSKQQEASTANDIYGYDSAYASSTGFSDGTYYKAIVTDGTVKQKMTNVSTFTFAGTGFDLISACGTNTGIQLIKVKNSEGKLINSYIIDTYFSTTDLMTDGGAEGSLLHQVPILSFRTKNHDTYTVEITAAYLSMAQALKHTGTAAVSYASAPVVAGNGVEIVTTTSTASSELINEFEKMGVDMGDNVELRWMDDNSVLNGGTGATEIATTVPKNGLLSGYAQQYLSSSVTSLANYIDGFRVYNPLNGGDPIYDIEKEQNPTYYNIVEDIGNASSGNFTYVQSGDPDFNFDENIFDYGAYLTQGGPKGEIYLEPGDAIAFRFNAETNGDDSVSVMLGMRAAKGSAIANVTTNDKGVVPVNKTVSSATEMYYDVSDAVTVVDGVVVIAVANTGTGTLAVNNLKLVNGTLKSAGTGETPSGSNDVIGGNSIVPEAVVPVVPVAPDANGNDAVQGDTPDTNLPENGEVDNTNPETDTKDNIEDNTEKDADNSVTTMFPGMPASIASFLELLFEFLGQLVSSLGF